MKRKLILIIFLMLFITTACGEIQEESGYLKQVTATVYDEPAKGATSTPLHTPTATWTLTPTPNPWEQGNPGKIRNVKDVAYNPRYELLAIAADKGIFLLDTSSFIQEGFFNTDDATSLAVSPDGEILAVGGSKVILFDFPGKYPLTEISTYGGQHITFSPDGSLLAVARGNVVTLWNISDSTQVAKLSHSLTVAGFESFPGLINRVVFAPKGKYLITTNIVPWEFETSWGFRMNLASSTERNKLRSEYEKSHLSKIVVWNWNTYEGQIQNSFPGNASAFTPDDQYLISIAGQSTNFEYRRSSDLTLANVIEELNYIGWSELEDIAITQDGNQIAVASWSPIGECDLILGIWKTDPWEKKWENCYEVEAGNHGIVTNEVQDPKLRLYRGILFSSNGDILFIWGKGTLIAISTETGEKVKQINSP
jgi:WD40 repeat protein